MKDVPAAAPRVKNDDKRKMRTLNVDDVMFSRHRKSPSDTQEKEKSMKHSDKLQATEPAYHNQVFLALPEHSPLAVR